LHSSFEFNGKVGEVPIVTPPTNIRIEILTKNLTKRGYVLQPIYNLETDSLTTMDLETDLTNIKSGAPLTIRVSYFFKDVLDP
jgi:hypothetical protein